MGCKSVSKDKNQVIAFQSAQRFVRFALIMSVMMVLSGCQIKYRFNGASIDYSKTQSISIADFPNHAALVNPNLSNDLGEGIRNQFSRQTRLQILLRGGDMELEGEITDYTLTPMSVSANSYSAETRLTITIRVRFTNNKSPEESFEKTYSAYQNFDSSRLLTDVQDELCATLVSELAETVFNETVARW